MVGSDRGGLLLRMSKHSLIVVGEVVKPHGLAGEFSIVSCVDSPDFFALVPRLFLREHARTRPRRSRPRRVRVESWRIHKNRVLLTLDQIQGRDEAERMRGAELLVREEDMPAGRKDRIYRRELIGVAVHLPSGTYLGRIWKVSETGGQELWTIHTEEGVEVLFPAHEQLVLKVDLERGIVQIDPPPGLLELYLASVKA